MGSVVVLNTCLFIVLLSNARKGVGGEESQITAKGVTYTAKGVPIDGKKGGGGGREGGGGVLSLCLFDLGRNGTPF
eukprot:COSAG02_NODE_20_length_53673_cov_86.864841_39_plen_76_part_00